MFCKCAEARARRVLVRKIISPIRGFACAIRMIEPTFPASPVFYINFEKTRLRLWQKRKRPQYFVAQMVLPAGIVRSGGRRDGTAIVRRRRDRVPLFRQSRREYKRDKACASMPCEMVLPAGIVRSGERRDGTAIVRRRRDRVTLFRQSRREYKRGKACVSMPCEMVLPAGIEPTTAP